MSLPNDSAKHVNVRPSGPRNAPAAELWNLVGRPRRPQQLTKAVFGKIFDGLSHSHRVASRHRRILRPEEGKVQELSAGVPSRPDRSPTGKTHDPLTPVTVEFPERKALDRSGREGLALHRLRTPWRAPATRPCRPGPVAQILGGLRTPLGIPCAGGRESLSNRDGDRATAFPLARLCITHGGRRWAPASGFAMPPARDGRIGSRIFLLATEGIVVDW